MKERTREFNKENKGKIKKRMTITRKAATHRE